MPSSPSGCRSTPRRRWNCPELFDDEIAGQVRQMLIEGVEAEVQFAEALLGQGVAGLPVDDMGAYLEHVADRRMQRLGLAPIYGSANPLAFMELQDVQELSNFFERRVSAHPMGITGSVDFNEEFDESRSLIMHGERDFVRFTGRRTEDTVKE